MVQSYFTPDLPSGLVVLAFLGTGFVLGMLFVAILVALAVHRGPTARWLALALVGCVAAYLAVLSVVSLTSREQVLRRGDRKYFCEIDCHTAYSVESVARAKTLGPPSQPATAAGTFTVVKLKTWFDEHTISSRRGDALLTPNPRQVFVVDAAGRKYFPDAAAGRALVETGAASKPLATPLRPGEAYETVFAFDLPADLRGGRLLLTDAADLPERFLIGHEKSLFHKKIYFALDAPPS